MSACSVGGPLAEYTRTIGARSHASSESSYWRHEGAMAVHRRSSDAASLAYLLSAVATSAAKAQSNPCKKNARDLSRSSARIQSFLLREVGVKEATSSSSSSSKSSSSSSDVAFFFLAAGGFLGAGGFLAAAGALGLGGGLAAFSACALAALATARSSCSCLSACRCCSEWRIRGSVQKGAARCTHVSVRPLRLPFQEGTMC